MKKILHISKYYYPYAGGIEDVCYNVVRIIQVFVNHFISMIYAQNGRKVKT